MDNAVIGYGMFAAILLFIPLANAQPMLNSTQLQTAIDKEVTRMKNEADVLKAQINSTNLAHTGQVENMINKVYYYEGEVSAVGGGTWAFLHDVQDTLLAKIKATGQSGFTAAELAAIDSFGNDAATSKQEHPSSNVFG